MVKKKLIFLSLLIACILLISLVLWKQYQIFRFQESKIQQQKLTIANLSSELQQTTDQSKKDLQAAATKTSVLSAELGLYRQNFEQRGHKTYYSYGFDLKYFEDGWSCTQEYDKPATISCLWSRCNGEPIWSGKWSPCVSSPEKTIVPIYQLTAFTIKLDTIKEIQKEQYIRSLVSNTPALKTVKNHTFYPLNESSGTPSYVFFSEKPITPLIYQDPYAVPTEFGKYTIEFAYYDVPSLEELEKLHMLAGKIIDNTSVINAK